MAQQPPATPPPGPPAPPPPPGYGPPGGYGPGGPGQRPGSATVGGVLLIVLGVIYGILGIIVIIAGGQAAGILGGGIGGAAIAIGAVLLIFGVLEVIAGVKVFGLSPGWRIGGIVLTAIGTLFSLLGLIGSFQGQEELQVDPNTFEFTTVSTGPNVVSIIIALLLLAANVTALIMLSRNGAAYVRR